MSHKRTTNCTHPAERQSSDIVTNEVLCMDCHELRDLMPWDEWDRLQITDPNGDEAPAEDDAGEVAA